MTVNVVSESKYFPNFFGGLHTAFLNHIKLLERSDIRIKINSLGKADITHIHSFGPLSLYKLLTNKHTVVSTHVVPATISWSFKGSKYWGNIFKKYLVFFYNHADLILALHSGVKEELESIGVVKRIEVLANPIDTDVFRPDEKLRDKGRERLFISKNSFVVLSSGSLMKRKGIRDFLEVAKTLPLITFVWVGDNASMLFDIDVKKKDVFKNKFPNILFPGNFSYEQMPEIYNTADVLFFPSYQEIASMVILEAAACGLPLILRDLPDYLSLYKKNYVACSTNAQFKKAIQDMMQNKDSYQKARNSSLSLAQKFSFKSVWEKLFTYYQSLL